MDLELQDHTLKANRAKCRLNRLFDELKARSKPAKANAKFIDLFKAVARRVKRPADLQLQFSSINTRLNLERTKETVRTSSEHDFQDFFQSLTKTHIANQIWIANHCADYFTASLGLRRDNFARGFTQKGVVFEIDGSSHDNPIKQKKDIYKDEFLLSLGILPLRIKNNEVATDKIKSIFSKLRSISTPDRDRLKTKIALITCLYNATDEEWINLTSILFTSEGKSHDKP